MKKFNYIASAKRTFKIESDSIKGLSTQLDKNFNLLCDDIRFNEGQVTGRNVSVSKVTDLTEDQFAKFFKTTKYFIK